MVNDIDIAYLKLYRPETYGLNLPKEVSKRLEAAGLVKWVPYNNQWSNIFEITEAGRKYLEERKSQ